MLTRQQKPLLRPLLAPLVLAFWPAILFSTYFLIQLVTDSLRYTAVLPQLSMAAASPGEIYISTGVSFSSVRQ